jgi:hypothetical protein
MRHAVRLGFLAVAVFLAGTPRADANIWDWLEALDGPGPSRSRGNLMANIFCSETRPNRVTGRLFEIPREANAQGTCLFIDVRRFHADEDDRFHPVDTQITEFGPSVRLHRAVELGAGVGYLSFHSVNPASRQEFDGTRMTISFPRLVFKPFMTPTNVKNPDWGFFQMYVRETIIVGELTQDDFASKPGNEFSRRHQRVRSMGFIIDAPSAFRLIKSGVKR